MVGSHSEVFVWCSEVFEWHSVVFVRVGAMKLPGERVNNAGGGL